MNTEFHVIAAAAVVSACLGLCYGVFLASSSIAWLTDVAVVCGMMGGF